MIELILSCSSHHNHHTKGNLLENQLWKVLSDYYSIFIKRTTIWEHPLFSYHRLDKVLIHKTQENYVRQKAAQLWCGPYLLCAIKKLLNKRSYRKLVLSI